MRLRSAGETAAHISAARSPTITTENRRGDGTKPPAKAHCTCSPKGLGIFDVVMRHDGCDFEAAKLRVAELLGRCDLIREEATQTAAGSGRGEPAESAAGAPG